MLDLVTSFGVFGQYNNMNASFSIGSCW